MVEENFSLSAKFGHKVMADIISSTGIERRPIALTETVAELGKLASERLLSVLNWTPESIEAVIVVTQTPDYPLPSTACLLQHELGLKLTTIALDINLGCSGYVYGLSVVNGLMQTSGIKRALLVCGDITSTMIDDGNRSLRPLFGDAISVTGLEAAEDSTLTMDLGTDGSGAPYLISHSGGVKKPGIPELFMDGVQVMAFTLKRVAPSIEAVLQFANIKINQIDAVVFHQANAMLLKSIARKIGANESQLALALKDFGNTSSASIPIALSHWLSNSDIDNNKMQILMSGFGVGWSWATALWKTSRPLVVEFVRS